MSSEGEEDCSLVVTRAAGGEVMGGGDEGCSW